MTTDKCILCLKKKPLTKEHIVPDSIGGNLIINALCKKCNSSIGDKIDAGYINSLLAQLPRMYYDIKGKSGDIPNPFEKVGLTSEGKKMRLSSEGIPYVIPFVDTLATSDGKLGVHIIIDKTDESKIDSILRKIIIRKKGADYPEKEIIKKIEEAKKNATYKTSKPEIQYKFNIDTTALRLEFIKIAYEIAFYVFGTHYIDSSVIARKMRKAIKKFDTSVHLRGQIPSLNDNLTSLFDDPNCHYVMMFQEACYIKLFNLSGTIQYCSPTEKFFLPENKAKLFSFNFINRTFKEEFLINYLASKSS